MNKILITSALPYVNNIPHLGNLIQVLSADVFARYCRLQGYETLYICGTDEYGTATETRAKEEGITAKELCDKYYIIHSDIYKWFNISFDRFGRTSTKHQTDITQDIFLKCDKNGYINKKTIKQLFCEKCDMFLADRFVRGTCPHCGYEDTKGDQCEDCGKLLETTELIDPKCSICGATPVIRETDHLYINLPAILPKLEEWIKETSVKGFWARNAVKMTEAWIRDGLKERCITRDLKWGIPVPKDGYRNKVFYVWFDAPIGYISITANHTKDWEKWWKNPEEVKLFQFIGKDNIPFHTVIFPSSLIGSGDNWTKLYHMSSTEYLNYEDGKFSKSKGIGVFGNDAKDTGIPADVWRFYIYYNRPEKSDTQFSWEDFQLMVNGELIGNLSNLVNRTITFISKYFDGKLPEGEITEAFKIETEKLKRKIGDSLAKVELRDAFRMIFQLSSLGNKHFQDSEPWKYVKENREKIFGLMNDLAYLIRDLAILIKPYMPETSEKISALIGIKELKWDELWNYSGISKIERPSLLFKKLEEKEINSFRKRFSGRQEERKTISEKFTSQIDLRVAKIMSVERHPKADKLYIEKIDLGTEKKQIVSGLVPYYTEDELIGRNIILAYNLKSAKLRGILSQGMLLAAENDDTVEVVFVEHANPGDRVVIEGNEDKEHAEKKEITIDEFFNIPIKVKNHVLVVENKPLVARGKQVVSWQVKDGVVG